MEATLERSDKQAWTIAAFTRAKKMPKYESLSRRREPKDGLNLKRALEGMRTKEIG